MKVANRWQNSELVSQTKGDHFRLGKNYLFLPFLLLLLYFFIAYNIWNCYWQQQDASTVHKDTKIHRYTDYRYICRSSRYSCGMRRFSQHTKSAQVSRFTNYIILLAPAPPSAMSDHNLPPLSLSLCWWLVTVMCCEFDSNSLKSTLLAVCIVWYIVTYKLNILYNIADT